MSCESSIADLTMEMFEEEGGECKGELLSHIKELHEAVTAMKSAFTEAQQQLESVQQNANDDVKLKEDIAATKNQCQQQSSEMLRLILSLQADLSSVKEMMKATHMVQHGLQSTIHTLLLDRDFLLDELAKNGAISDTVRGRLHTRLNGYLARPSSGSQSTNDSGVALLGENGSNKSGNNNHSTLSATTSNDNCGGVTAPNHGLLLHQHLFQNTLGSTSPVPGVNTGVMQTASQSTSDAISAAEHHLLSHHLPPSLPPHHPLHSHHHQHLMSPHVQEYLNNHHHHHATHLHQLHSQCRSSPYRSGDGLPSSSSPTGANGSSANHPTSSMALLQSCCCPTIPPPHPLTYTSELTPGGVVYDSDSSLTLAAAKSLSLSNSLSKQCGLELDHQQLLNDHHAAQHQNKKGRRNSSSNDSTSSCKDGVTTKCISNGRTCDVIGGGGGDAVVGGGSAAASRGSSGGDPSCYNSDAELGLTDESNIANGKSGKGTNGANGAVMSFKENQRMKVAKELLDTERKYCHTLKTIQDTFALPLKSSGILSMKDINTLFPEEVFKLYEKHCALLSQLEERVSSWKSQPTVGDLLERFINGEDANVLRLYTSYVNDFPEVLKTFHKLCRSCTDFTRFLKSTLEHPTCGGLDLGAFLLTPVQRMPRYILLLKQMMKFTDVSHPDYKDISICLDRLREYLKRLNDSMEHSFQLVTAQISPQPHEPMLEKLMGFSGKNHFPRASTSSQSSTGDHDHHQAVVHKVRYKRSTSVPRNSYSSTSETGGPKSMPAGSSGGGGQKEGKSKLKSRSKSDWTVCNNVNGSKTSLVHATENEGATKRCTSCNCASQQNTHLTKLSEGGGEKHHSRYKGKKAGSFGRTFSDSDINSDGDEGSLEDQKETATRKFSTSKSLHDFNQDDDDDIDAGNLEWFISEPSLCEMKHTSSSAAHHHSVVTPDEDGSMHLARTSSSLRRNMMIRPMTTHPSGRVVARLSRASESEMNLHMLEKAGDKERAPKTKSKMSLRNSLKNIFSIKKRYRSGGSSNNKSQRKSSCSESSGGVATSASASSCCANSTTTISTATATANYRVVYTDGGKNSEQRVALLKNATNLPSCLVSAGTSFTASMTNINNICTTTTSATSNNGHHHASNSVASTATANSSSSAVCCSSELKALGISPLLQYLHRMPSYLELIMFSVRETTV